MTSFSLIPAIDIIDGQLVRLYKGDYSKKTNYDSNKDGFWFSNQQKTCHIYDVKNKVFY